MSEISAEVLEELIRAHVKEDEKDELNHVGEATREVESSLSVNMIKQLEEEMDELYKLNSSSMDSENEKKVEILNGKIVSIEHQNPVNLSRLEECVQKE